MADYDSSHTGSAIDDAVDGTFTAVTTTTLETSTINLTGGQIAFPATQNESAGVNTLDDYEEGTYTVTITPTTSGTVTVAPATKTASYTKIGRKVHVQGKIDISAVSSPVGVAKINLPFPVGALTESSDTAIGSMGFTAINLAATSWVNSYAETGNSYFTMRGTNDNGAWADEDANILAASDAMAFSLTYFI